MRGNSVLYLYGYVRYVTLHVMNLYCFALEFESANRPISYIKIQPKTIDVSTRLWGITTEFVGFIPQSFLLRSILIDRNWSITLVESAWWEELFKQPWTLWFDSDRSIVFWPVTIKLRTRFNFTTAKVVCITAMIDHVFISFSAVQLHDLSYIHLQTSKPETKLP